MSLIKWLIWALFGNDDDGPYGFYPHTTLGAIRWWLRNPFHNLFSHALAMDNPNPKVLFGTPENPSQPFWPERYGVLVAVNFAPLVSFRTPVVEGYIGFRPRMPPSGTLKGVFGIALRHFSGF